MQTLASLFGAAFVLTTAWTIGAFLFRKRPAPPEIALAVGAAVESLLVFGLLLANAAGTWSFAAMAVAALGLGGARVVAALKNGAARPARPPLYLALMIAPYAVWCFVNALAPEITPDGMTYHLGLAREYVRLGGFPGHLYFYDLA